MRFQAHDVPTHHEMLVSPPSVPSHMNRIDLMTSHAHGHLCLRIGLSILQDVVDGALVVQRVLSKRKKFTKAGCVVSAHTRISPVALADTAPHVCPCSDRASRAAAAAAVTVTCARSRSGL